MINLSTTTIPAAFDHEGVSENTYSKAGNALNLPADLEATSLRNLEQSCQDAVSSAAGNNAGMAALMQIFEQLTAMLEALLLKMDDTSDEAGGTNTAPGAGSGTASSSNNKQFDMVVDDMAGTLFSVTGADGGEVVIETDSENNLLIDGVNYGDVDDDDLSFSIVNDQLNVTKDGSSLKGFTPIDVEAGSGATFGLDNLTQTSQSGSVIMNDSGNGESQFFDSSTPRANDGGYGSTAIGKDISPVGPITGVELTEGSMSFSDFLSSSLTGSVNGLEQQKFQYGGYDSSEVTTLRDWDEILATGAVTENADGSITLTSSSDIPRVQFYPDDDVAGGRESTSVSDLKDIGFDFAIDDWQEGEAAWLYELHELGDGQAFAFGFNEEGNLLMTNGNNSDRIESDISFVDAGGVEVNYEGNVAHVSVLNKDGSVRGNESINLNASEVHVKGIEVYNRRSAADTSVSVTYNNMRSGV